MIYTNHFRKIGDNGPLDLGIMAADDTGILSKQDGKKLLKENRKRLYDLTDVMYAEGKHAMLVIFQATDAAGKDSAIKHVFRKVRPQIIKNYNFKKPSMEEARHDFLWRHLKCIPARGEITVFNRSYYEEVIATRVHTDFLIRQNLPGVNTEAEISDEIWMKRYSEINHFEKYLHENGIEVVKFYLNISSKKQLLRFLRRIRRPDKFWKFNFSDLEDHEYYDDFRKYSEAAIRNTATPHAPWYVIPADNKWYTRAAVSQVLTERLSALDMYYPQPDEKAIDEMEKAYRLITDKLDQINR